MEYRQNAYEIEGISRTYEGQAAMLVSEKKDGNFNGVFSQVLQDVLRRLDRSFKAFFRRVKTGDKPGYPRFKGEGWYKSFTYPQYYVQAEEKLAAAQRNISGKKNGSANRRKAKAKVVKLHQKIQNHRDEFLHQVSRKLVDSADLIVFENLNISIMLKNHHLAKHIQDHAWGKLIQFTQSKAAKAGKIVELVDARYTSQKCSQCGIMVPKTLAERVHHCPNCGLEMDRDINASLNIRTLGLRGSAYQDPTPTLSKLSKQVRSMT